MTTESGYAQSEGIRLIEAAVQAFGPLFTLEQLCPLAEQQGLSATHTRKLLSMLRASGWIENLKRGVYAVRKPFYAADIPPFAVAAALMQPCAISHWSALAHHGFTTQLPVMVQASTPRKVVTPEMRQGAAHRPRGRAVWTALGVEIEYIYVQASGFFGHEQIWVSAGQQVAITDPERTALDLLARPDIFGGIRASMELFETALPQLDIEKLVGYTLRSDVGAVIKRAGWLLEQLDVPAASLAPLQAYPVTSYYRLDPQLPVGTRYNAHWRINENIGEAAYG